MSSLYNIFLLLRSELIFRRTKHTHTHGNHAKRVKTLDENHKSKLNIELNKLKLGNA